MGPPPTAPTAPRRGAGRPGNGRVRGRGGIQKRRADTRTDTDGDVAMDSINPGASSGRGGRGHLNAQKARNGPRTSSRLAAKLDTYGTSAPSKERFAKPVLLKVLGVKQSKAASNPDGGERSLVVFLEKKASKNLETPIKINKSVTSGEHVVLSVSKSAAPEFLKLNNFDFAGSAITITETDEPWPRSVSAAKAPTAETQSVKEDLKAVLASRYNAEARLLDLSALGQDPILVSKGFFEEASRAVKAFSALITIASGAYKSAQEKKEGVQYVSLANNALDNVAHVFDLAKHFPGIVGLDLSNNQFSKITQLGRWRHHFPELSELRLAGNPLVAEEPNLETEVKAWFPKLLQLDGKLVRTPAEVAAQAPIPIPQVGFDFRDTSGLGEGFLREFFALYDADRAALAKKFYDEDSTFSAAIIVASIKGSDKAILPWKPYLRFSRNIKFLGARNNENRRRLFRGAQFISDVWKQLPATKHVPIEEIDKWVVDAHIVHDLADPTGTGTTVDGLVITVNGEFEELSEAGKAGHRTFSRHFLLGPAKPGRGTIIRVISDQITLRGHQPIAVNSPQAPMPPNGLDDALKLKMVQELSERTGMTLEYSQLCLSGEANWHFHLALRSFDALCGTLPADAFINGKPSHVA